MAFKSYSWKIGNTSFRVSHLNYKIERQLQLLKEFWNDHDGEEWNEETEKKYYYYLKENGFVKGDAPRPEKDAREVTSGLVDIGVLDKKRRITDVGYRIESLLNQEKTKNNIFCIDDDSYCYLLQFLKLQFNSDGLKIRPFIAMLYMIEKLGYLTYDEFTYLLPLCKNSFDVKEMVGIINTNRQGIDLDYILSTRIYNMDNYMQTLTEFINTTLVTKETIEMVGMNRKSPTYDHAYLPIYDELVNLVFNLKKSSFDERLESYERLYKNVDKILGKYRLLWRAYLFSDYNPKSFDEKFDDKFKDLEISKSRDIVDFKKMFFERIHVIKWKVNLKEYFDLNKRYFSLPDIIKFSDDKIELDLLPKYYFKDIIDDLLDEELLNDEEYYEIFHSSVSIDKISDKYTTNIEDVIDIINKDLKTKLTVENINTYLEDEKIKQFNKLIDEKFNENSLINLLDLIKNRSDSEVCSLVTDNADVPTIFEYIIGIIWYRISNKEGNILKFMNLSLDADLLPKTHAGGGVADIVYEYGANKYPKHNLLIEATLSESTGQRHMEMEPVSRHLGEDISKTNNDNDYAIFVTPNLEERIILDFRNMKSRYYPKQDGNYVKGLKIIPINTDILKKIIIDKRNYRDLYDIFDKAYLSNLPDPEWFEKEIMQNI